MEGPANVAVSETRPLRAGEEGNKSLEQHTGDKDSLFKDVPIKSFVIACLANLYEYYDFALLGFFANEVGATIFPNGSDVTYAIEVYSLYAVGFLFRPFGGAFFGYMGDKIGRKNALRLSMIMMAFPTFLTGCLPSYNLIGWWSPALLLVFRVIQGLSTGGENSNVATYVFEIARRDRRAFFMSLLGVSTSGTLVASLFHVILSASMSESDLTTYGWRIPFLFGIGLIFVVCLSKMEESSTFTEMKNRDEIVANPVTYGCTKHFDILIKFICVSCVQHCTAYATYVFLPSYLTSKEMHGWADSSAYGINAINNVIGIPLILLVGYLVDFSKHKALTFLYPGCVLSLLCSPVLFWGFSQTTEGAVWQDWGLQFILTLIYCNIHGCIYYWYLSSMLIDPRTRVTLFGLGYNLGAAFFGGTASLIGTALVGEFGSENGMLLLGSYIAILSVITMSSIYYVERGNKNGHKYDNVSYYSRMPLSNSTETHGTSTEPAGSTDLVKDFIDVVGSVTDMDGEYDPIE